MIRRSMSVILLVLAFTVATSVADEPNFSGKWRTSYGLMQLTQDGVQVSGSYKMGDIESSIEGKIKDGKFEFVYREPAVKGEGWFKLADDGKSFEGRWREDGQDRWLTWVGRRLSNVAAEADAQTGFAGLWETTHGRLRLVKNGDEISGIYSNTSSSTISGKVKDNRLTFRYDEPDVDGDGWFELSEDGQKMTGKWKADGTDAWHEWNAIRIFPKPNHRWLVVVEARWEANLAEREYAFGDMLEAFFARAPNVHVRHRFFNDANDIRRWVREVAYLAEPVVLCIASHGTEEGVQVDGKTIPPDVIADSLKYADNVQLLHFSACLMMKEQLAGTIMKQLGPQADFPISGYTTSVDWAASAVIEFTYFDLVLVRGMSPAKAYEQTKILYPTAGDKPILKATIPPAGFRILLPEEAEPPSK